MSATLTRTVSSTRFLVREDAGGDRGGRPVLLLHGVPETSSCWRDLAPRIAATGRRVLAPDLPGLGGSAYTGPYDAASVAAEVAALVEDLVGTGTSVDVVGHDWGGVVALALAGTRPDLVRRLVVANAPYRDVPLLRAPHIPVLALPLVPDLAFRLAGGRLVDLMLQVGWKAPTRLDPEVQAEYRAAYSSRDNVAAMLGYYRAAARPRLRAALPGGADVVPLPVVRAERTLVLWGAADPVLPVNVAESVARDLGPDCVVVTVPGAGHFVIEEAPDVVAETVLDVLGDPVGEGAPTPAPRADEATPATQEPTRAPVPRAPAKKAPPAQG